MTILLIVACHPGFLRHHAPPSLWPFAYSSSYSAQTQYFSSPYSDHLQLTHPQNFSMHNDSVYAIACIPPNPNLSSACPLFPITTSSIPCNFNTIFLYYSSSPSSQGSDTIGTPPTKIMMYPASSSNANGKRPSSSNNMDSRKKARKDDDSETQSPVEEKEEVKAKPTGGSWYVLAFHISIEFWQSFQCLHSLQAFENEVHGCRTRASMQTILNWQPRMSTWRIQSRENVLKVGLSPSSL